MAGYEVARLTGTDLAKLRKTKSHLDVVELRFPGITPDEAIGAHEEYRRLVGEIIQDYGVDETEDWHVSTFTGGIYYQ